MLIDSTVLPKITDSFSSLVFFFDPLHKKVLFANMPLQHFFGMPVNLEDDIPFGIDDKKEARQLAHDWLTCMQLKEKQSHQFTFRKELDEDSGIIFQFNALGVRMENAPGHANSILFSAEKSPAGIHAGWIMKSERLRKTLQRYKEEYAEFIDIAAHNLDAPLRKLNVLMERLAAKYPAAKRDEDTKGYIGRIDGCLTDMRSLIDSLATLSRVSSATTKVETCELEGIMKQEWDELKQQVREKQAVLTMASLPVIEGDLSQYKCLFKNLLENAVRFSKNDTVPNIHISSQTVSEKDKTSYGLQKDTNYYKIICKDNGIGFRQEYADKIFRPFVRLHGKSEYPGNGIGLALVRSIVDNHGGVIYAEGAENEGARFILLLPQTID